MPMHADISRYAQGMVAKLLMMLFEPLTEAFAQMPFDWRATIKPSFHHAISIFSNAKNDYHGDTVSGGKERIEAGEEGSGPIAGNERARGLPIDILGCARWPFK
jgi:hypothetical protein